MFKKFKKVLMSGVLLLLILSGIVVYFVLTLRHGKEALPVWAISGDNRQGKRAILAYGCHGCHVISGVREATGRVGPKLEEIDRQIYIGGVLPNTPDNMRRWIVLPRRFSPNTAMPDLDVSESDARNITAFLFRK